jgi:hypothetical protein
MVAIAVFFFKNMDHDSTINLGDSSGTSASDSVNLLTFKKRDFGWQRPVDGGGSPSNFDLFTGPYAYVEDGKIVTKSYDMLIIDDAFPLYLAEIQPKPYRLEVVGYSQLNDSDPFAVMLHDIESNRYGDCTVGTRNGNLGLRVKSVEIQEREIDGTIFEVPLVRVYDEIAKKEFAVTNERKILDGEFIVMIKDIGGNEYIFRDVSSTIKIGEAFCTLCSFDKNEGTAKLLLRDAQGQEFNKVIHLMR